MKRRSCDYYYKSYDIGCKNPIDKKRYEYLNEYGANIDSYQKKEVDFEIQIKRHKNSDCR